MATKTMEPVFIKDVNGPNQRGWYEIEVAEYDEPLTTKEKKLADAAFAAKDTTVLVDQNMKVNGDFTNRYLNDVQPFDGEAPAPTAEQTAAREAPTKRDERAETQERIARQWAMGRAVELHIASGGALKDVLDTEKFAEIKAVADVLLLATSAG